ncbi:MAG: hypothetical protein ACQEQM_00995 [Thermoplasmatota archaeon]
MVLMLDKEDVKKVKDLSLRGERASDIAKKLDCDVEAIQKVIGSEDVITEEISQEKQSKAFKGFSEGKNPVDLVEEKLLNVDEAGLLYKKYEELLKLGETKNDEKISIEKLSTQLGLLGSRLSRVELKVMNSKLLPETQKCSKCRSESSYSVGVVCSNCNEIDMLQDEKEPADIVKGIQDLVQSK